MIRLPPSTTRTYTLFPSWSAFRSRCVRVQRGVAAAPWEELAGMRHEGVGPGMVGRRAGEGPADEGQQVAGGEVDLHVGDVERSIGADEAADGEGEAGGRSGAGEEGARDGEGAALDPGEGVRQQIGRAHV